MKYNHDDGKVDVSLNADHKFFYIRVKDTGCGIPEDCQEQIFERFYPVWIRRVQERRRNWSWIGYHNECCANA